MKYINSYCFWRAIILLISLTFNAYADQGERHSLTFRKPSSCRTDRNETFSRALLNCVNCYKLAEDGGDDLAECPCPKGSRKLNKYEISSSANGNCVNCPEGSGVYDMSYCIKCEDGKVAEEGEKCLPCAPGSIQVAFNEDGSPLETVRCVPCASGYTPDPDGTKCIPCHSSFPPNSKCHCPEKTHTLLNGICFETSELKDPPFDRRQFFKLILETRTIESALFQELTAPAYYLCKNEKNESACQTLANLCTLNLHSFAEGWDVCGLFRAIFTGPITHPPIYVPKLYYSDAEASSLLVRSSLVPHQFTRDFSHHQSNIDIVVARFSLQGDYLGLIPLVDIIFCQEQQNTRRISRKFGTSYSGSCTITLRELLTKETEFLEPYLKYHNSTETILHAVPIKVLNYKRNGQKLNQKREKFQWQFVRRFFLVDNIAGFESTATKSFKHRPKFVRYAKTINIDVKLQNGATPGKIYIPLITIDYEEIGTDKEEIDKKIALEYSVKYFMDMSRAIEDVKIAVGVVSSFAVIMAAMQTWSWNRRNGKAEIDLRTILNLVLTSCGHLADTFFLVCFCSSLYWFIFFKGQAYVHVLLPTREQERIIHDLLIAAFALKIVDVVLLVWKHASIDIFFIDWEKPKASHDHLLLNNSSKKKDDIGFEGNVSIWRTYFIANEWNEIQTIRKINIETQLVITIFFLEVVGLRDWGLSWPESVLNVGPESKNIPFSTAARFVTCTLVFGIIGIIQWVYRTGIHERFINNHIQDFVDLCTLSNISVFILAASQQGYYIHGRSVHGFADTDMHTMIEQLQREEEDLCGRRGLLPQTDQQTFLISVPSSFRGVYNLVLQPLYASANVGGALERSRQLVSNAGGGNQLEIPAKSSSSTLSLSIKAYHSMNRFLTAFLEHALTDLEYDVKSKSFFEATFDMELGDLYSDRAVFYTDNGHSFDSVLFYGNEKTLFMFNLYVFIFVDMLSQNYILALFVTYFADVLVRTLRKSLGKNNLARKTMIDSRFLI